MIVKPPSTLLIGPPGSGKTHSLVTYLKAGLKLAVVITDPGGEESLIEACEKEGADITNLHYRYIAPAAPSFATLMDMAKKINMLPYKDLTELKSGINKQDFRQFYELLATLSNFVCQRTDKEIGPVDELDSSWALAIDSASGLNTMVMTNMIGAKPAAHQGEWGAAMNSEERLIDKLTSDLKCFFCLTAHVEREMDETIGRPINMASFLGRKLAPKIPRNFSDVVYTVREADKFRWSTTASNIDLKARTLKLSDNLEPSFEQVVEGWQRRVKMAEASSATSATSASSGASKEASASKS